MNQLIETDVLIVGAGPVGLTLALDLAWRGVDVVVIERRQPAEPPRIRSNHVSARSMEIFRRLGVAKMLRDAGLPANYPNDVAYCTSVTGIELTRIPIPSRAERYTAVNGPDTWWPTPEPPHRINQIYLEPLLFAEAQTRSRIRIIAPNCARPQYVCLADKRTRAATDPTEFFAYIDSVQSPAAAFPLWRLAQFEPRNPKRSTPSKYE